MTGSCADPTGRLEAFTAPTSFLLRRALAVDRTDVSPVPVAISRGSQPRGVGGDRAFAQERHHQAYNSAYIGIGRRSTNSACRARPSRLFTWSARTTPATARPLGSRPRRDTLDAAGYGTAQGEADLAVADGDKMSAGRWPVCSWPAAGAKRQPEDVATPRHIAACTTRPHDRPRVRSPPRRAGCAS
jgi:hypothetical protein